MASFTNPNAISEQGREIYAQKYQAEYERVHSGKFVAINMKDGSSTLGDTADQALSNAKSRHPEGFFHLIRVGHRSAFELGPAYKNAASHRVHR